MGLLKKRNKQDTLFVILCGVVSFVTLGFFFIRLFYGVDFTDETWYYAEPYFVAKGAVPFVNNWNQSPGVTLPLALAFKVFVSINNGTEGIVLFSRILYFCWTVLVGVISCLSLKEIIDIKYTYPLAVFLPFVGYNLFDVNYNTVGPVYFLLTVSLLISASLGSEKNKFLISTLAGLIIARAVIGTPYLLIAWPILFVYLFFKDKKIFKGFLCGTLLAAIIVCGWCIILEGTGAFATGLIHNIKDLYYFKIEKRANTSEDYKSMLVFFKPFLICFCSGAAINILSKRRINAKIMLLIFFVLFIHGIIICLREKTYDALTKWSWYYAVVINLFVDFNKKFKGIINWFSKASLLFVIVFAFSSIINVWGFGTYGRVCWLIIPFAFSLVSFQILLSDNYKLWRAICIVLEISFCFILVLNVYTCMYREESVDKLNTKVVSGIWKGCYTTENRALGVTEMEEFIDENTFDDDLVLCLDWASFGYVMCNGTPCAPSSLDSMAYTYGVDEPIPLYYYFVENNCIPSKIIYIDYGRDNCFSIETDWKFNDFVNNGYSLSNTFDGEYRVLIYDLVNEESAWSVANNYIAENGGKTS